MLELAKEDYISIKDSNYLEVGMVKPERELATVIVYSNGSKYIGKTPNKQYLFDDSLEKEVSQAVTMGDYMYFSKDLKVPKTVVKSLLKYIKDNKPNMSKVKLVQGSKLMNERYTSESLYELTTDGDEVYLKVFGDTYLEITDELIDTLSKFQINDMIETEQLDIKKTAEDTVLIGTHIYLKLEQLERFLRKEW